jgi:hypothetical protein
MQLRHRFTKTETLEQRLAEYSKSLHEQAKLLPPGAVRDATIRKARQAQIGSQINDWLRSPGLQPPR